MKFSQYVYNSIMSGRYVLNGLVTYFTDGHIYNNEFHVVYDYSTFGKKRIYLCRYDHGNTYEIPLNDDEQKLLWSVWPKVIEDRKIRIEKKNAAREKLVEKMQWWP